MLTKGQAAKLRAEANAFARVGEDRLAAVAQCAAYAERILPEDQDATMAEIRQVVERAYRRWATALAAALAAA